MSYPPGFDLNQFDNSSVSRANNAAQIPNNSYPVQLDPYQTQSYGALQAPMPYLSSNHSIQPPNMIFPPIDFSVPPPNFPPMNVMSVNQPSNNMPPLPHQSLQQPHQGHPQQYHSMRSQNREHSRNDKRRDFKETSRWRGSSPSSSASNASNRRNRSKERSYEREKSTSKYTPKKEFSRDRVGSRDRSGDRSRDRNLDRNRTRDRDRSRDRNRSRNERDRNSNERSQRRENFSKGTKDRSRSGSNSRSTSSYCRSKSEHSNRYKRVEKTISRSSSKNRGSSILLSKRNSSPVKIHDDETKNTDENISTRESEKTERARILEKWRSNYCETSEDITRKLEELADDTEKECWIRSSPSDLHYKRTSVNEIEGTARLEALCTLFKTELVDRGPRVRKLKPVIEAQPKKRVQRVCRHKSDKCSSSDSSDDDFNIEDDCPMEELTKKIKHPYRLHPDLWHNEAGEMNDGPLCRCSVKSRRSGIRHGIYPGEVSIPKCNPNSNNAGKLYHYKITVSPPTNFLTKTPTMIKHDEHEFLFEGFSLLSHSPIAELPTCSVIRFNIEYKIVYFEEKMPENFTIQELDLFSEYLFTEILEMLDFSLGPKDGSCSCFHFLPRFVRDLPDNGKEVLSMSEVLRHLLDNSGPLVSDAILKEMQSLQQRDWQDYVDDVKGMVVTNPGMKPCSVRVDQLDRNVTDLPECIDPDDPTIIHPVIVHFGVRPPQLSYAGNPEYQKSWREYVKFRHLVANMSKPSFEDKRKLESKESRLQEMRTQGRMKRNVTIAIVSRGFYRTGIMCDIVQHALLIPVLTTHLRFHQSLNMLENNIDYKFKNRYLLQLALSHPSYKENFGTNPDHARNSLTNCGIRQPEYGDRKIHYLNTRKRGINTLINIMSRFGRENETDSSITHNERLEFLGDAVVEFLTSIHLFFMFPDLEEGGLATYRAAIVQNQHLAVLAKKLRLDEFMLYAHGSDLCHELELRHAMANCFEALMGALLLDGGIEVADKVFANTLFLENPQLKDVWVNYPPHPLQEQEPLGDRQWIDSYPLLKDLSAFEDSIGIKFRHIRLLARAFTDRSIGFTHLTLGSNQRLEFLGDTVLQLICSEFLYRHFPEHHEGHLSLLRSSLVNNRTQAVVCDDLGMTKYAIYSNPKNELKTKDRADLLEAFLGALYVDKGLPLAETFCQVCLFPRLQMFIMNQDWTDSSITHNERLEFLGDAVVEFLTSIHLFFMFPDLEEGGLATYRAAIVQNQHLAVLAKKLRLDEFMLYAHGSDLCHELELRHAMANCFEALMGALLLDGGIEVADKVFANTLFLENPQLKDVWVNYPPHPLQEQEPLGDRQWIDSYPLLKDLSAFEDSIGIKFRHIRLLARAFTDRSIGFTHLTLGSNQRLEFLGDTVLQLICSEFLYRHFPEHHEGHLSLLRSSLVNNRTQAVVCDDLGMTKYAIYSNPKNELKTKDRADLLEAFLGALYVDKGLPLAETFCQVCLFPRLQMFIMNQDWNDPKSKLQQCCLTLRTMDGGEPDIPIYKVIECTGPTNTRVYKVAVYFRGKRLASSTGHSIQQAEMEAAKKALENSSELFPQLDYQKRVMAHSMKRQKGKPFDGDKTRSHSSHEQQRLKRKIGDDDSNLPKQYRVRKESRNAREKSSESDESSSSDAECSDSSHENDEDKETHNHDTCNQKIEFEENESAQIKSDEPNDEENMNSQEPETSKSEQSSPKNCEIADESDTNVSLESGEIL